MQSAEYLVVIEVLDRARGRDRARIYRALEGSFDRSDIDSAIDILEQAGVVAVNGATVKASPALTKLATLNLIGV